MSFLGSVSGPETPAASISARPQKWRALASARGGGSGLENPWSVRGGSRGRSGPGGLEEVRPGPRPRDSSSSGAGRVSGSAGFGMTQSPRLGPGASSALPVGDSPTVGGFRCSQECPRGGRARLCARRPWGTRWWFCPVRNVQDRVPSLRVYCKPHTPLLGVTPSPTSCLVYCSHSKGVC